MSDEYKTVTKLEYYFSPSFIFVILPALAEGIASCCSCWLTKSNRVAEHKCAVWMVKSVKYPSQNLLILLKQEPLVENIEYYSLGQI